MKKALAFLFLLLIGIIPSLSEGDWIVGGEAGYKAVLLQYKPVYIDHDPLIKPMPRTPKAPMYIYYRGNHLVLNESLVGFDLELTNDGDAVVYGVTVVSTETDLPESLEGKFTITFSQGDDFYEGTISL